MPRTRFLRTCFIFVLLLTLAGCGSSTSSGTAPSTATAITKNCFVDPSGPRVPAVYAASATPTSGPAPAPAVSGTPVTLSNGLKYVDIKTGSGPAAHNGSTVTVNYTGWLASTCQKFDSSYDSHGSQPAQPFSFPLGQGQVVKGWDNGLVGMKAGGIRRLFIPSALGYGSQANGPIPANSDLIFDVQMVSMT